MAGHSGQATTLVVNVGTNGSKGCQAEVSSSPASQLPTLIEDQDSLGLGIRLCNEINRSWKALGGHTMANTCRLILRHRWMWQTHRGWLYPLINPPLCWGLIGRWPQSSVFYPLLQRPLHRLLKLFPRTLMKERRHQSFEEAPGQCHRLQQGCGLGKNDCPTQSQVDPAGQTSCSVLKLDWN